MVQWCTAVEDLLNSYRNAEPDTFRKTQRMKADKCIREMVGVTQVENQPHNCIKD